MIYKNRDCNITNSEFSLGINENKIRISAVLMFSSLFFMVFFSHSAFAQDTALDHWDLDMNTGHLNMTFDEPVNASTLNVTGITIQDSTTASYSYTLTDSATSSGDGTSISITLSTTDVNAIKSNTNIAVNQGTSYLTITSDVIDDMDGNAVNAITDGNAVQTASFTPDIIAPVITVQNPQNTTYAYTLVWANITLDEPAYSCVVYLDDAGPYSMTNSSGNWNYLMDTQSNSLHVANFSCTDFTYVNANDPSSNFVFFTTNDTTLPTINYAVTDRSMVDLDYYYGGYSSNYFNSGNYVEITVNANSMSKISSVQVNVTDMLLNLLYPQVSTLPSFSESQWEGYLIDSSRYNASASASSVDSYGNGNYTFDFYPLAQIYNLYNSYSVISYTDLDKLVSEELTLGNFTFPIYVIDAQGLVSTTNVNTTIVDLLVPINVGWNLRSTPIRLEGGTYLTTGSINAVLKWNSSAQDWELVTDNSIAPLDAMYIHSTGQDQIGYTFYRGLTAPPLRQLYERWNLVGPANQLFASLSSSYTSLEDMSYYYQHYGGTCVAIALASVEKTPDGSTGWIVATSPFEYLDYTSNKGDWYFYEYAWAWTSNQVPSMSGAHCFDTNSNTINVDNFYGYWVYMENNDTLVGFTTTPLQIY